MRARRVSARTLLMVVFLLLSLVSAFTFYFTARAALNSAPAEIRAELLDNLRRNLIFGGLACGALALVVGLLAGGQLSRPLIILRAELSDLLRGDRAETTTRSRIAEIDRLGQALTSLIRDATGQQRLLEQERDELINLLESGTEGLLQVNAQGRIVHVNGAARELLGLPPHAHGESITTLVRQADLRDLIVSTVAGETPAPRELDLDDRQLLVIGRVLPNAGGAVVAILDLTEVRRLEAVRRDFVANVSHELKTPLTSIRGYAETLTADDLPRELRLQFLDVIQKNASRIHRIVDDLLDLSRLQSGGWRPEIQDVDVAELAEDVWVGCQAAAQKSVDFDVAASGRTHVAADPAGVRQVFANLFDNALRYTPEGGRVRVRIRELRNGRAADLEGAIEVQVQDTGTGVPRDALPRIFERFYRVDPARSRAEGGTGLGLSIVKHLIERMDGDVAAESELGKGTTIRFRLPAA